MIRAAVVAIGALALFVPAGVAHADPATVPTDFATEVVGIEPATPTITSVWWAATRSSS